jgi:hypothetical protein
MLSNSACDVVGEGCKSLGGAGVVDHLESLNGRAGKVEVGRAFGRTGLRLRPAAGPVKSWELGVGCILWVDDANGLGRASPSPEGAPRGKEDTGLNADP